MWCVIGGTMLRQALDCSECQQTLNSELNSGLTSDVGADVVLVASRAEVDLRRRLVDLGRRAEEPHGWTRTGQISC